MKKRIVSLVAFLLIYCMTLTACSSGEVAATTETEEPVQTEEIVQEEEIAQNEEVNVTVEPGTAPIYTYIVCGEEFRLHTRVEDYLTDDGVFLYFDLASDLGWHAKEEDWDNNPNVLAKTYRSPDCVGGYVTFMFGYDEDNNLYPVDTIRFGYFYNSESWDIDEDRDIRVRPNSYNDSTAYHLLRIGSPRTIRFTEVVLLTYILENYKTNQDSNWVFTGIFEEDDYHVFQAYE